MTTLPRRTARASRRGPAPIALGLASLGLGVVSAVLLVAALGPQRTESVEGAWSGGQTVEGTVSPGDADVHEFDVRPPGDLKRGSLRFNGSAALATLNLLRPTNGTPVRVTIEDAAGRPLLSQLVVQPPASMAHLPTARLATGTYFLRVQNAVEAPTAYAIKVVLALPFEASGSAPAVSTALLAGAGASGLALLAAAWVASTRPRL